MFKNGITLSKKAHQEFHKIYGKKNNTREQLEEFLKLLRLKNKPKGREYEEGYY